MTLAAFYPNEKWSEGINPNPLTRLGLPVHGDHSDIIGLGFIGDMSV